MFWPVSQIPQGAIVFANVAPSNPTAFTNTATMQVSSPSFMPMEQYQQTQGSDGSLGRDDFYDLSHKKRGRQGRVASPSSGALTSEEIDELRLAVQKTVHRLQNPGSSDTNESLHSERMMHSSKSDDYEIDTLSSSSSTCVPESRIERWEDAVDDDDIAWEVRQGLDESNISDTEIDYMFRELECSNADNRQKAIEWVVSLTQRLAFTRRGCRIVQRAMEVAVWGDQERLVEKLEGIVLEALQSPHANYVLQKCFEIMPPHKLQFVVEELKGHSVEVARHRFGCRVLQRALEHCPPDQIEELVAEVLMQASPLVRHTYGNFVIQHVLQYGTAKHVRQTAEVLLADAVRFANHRIASHVMSCALACCAADDVRSLKEVLLREREKLTDRHHGSFVVRQCNRVRSH
jgi:hypothetical protein